MIVTALDTSFDRLIAEATDVLGLGLVPLGLLRPLTLPLPGRMLCLKRPSKVHETRIPPSNPSGSQPCGLGFQGALARNLGFRSPDQDPGSAGIRCY